MAANAARGAEIYVANLTGAGATPASGLANAGTGYFALNNDNISGRYWINHNVTNLPTYGRIEFQNTAIQRFEDRQINSTFNPYDSQFTSSAVTDGLRAGEHLLELYNLAYPNGAIGGTFTQVVFATATDNRNRASLANTVNAPGSMLEYKSVLVGLARVATASQFEAYGQMSGRTLYSQSV